MSNYGKGCFNITPVGNVRYRFKYTDMFGNRRVKSVWSSVKISDSKFLNNS